MLRGSVLKTGLPCQALSRGKADLEIEGLHNQVCVSVTVVFVCVRRVEVYDNATSSYPAGSFVIHFLLYGSQTEHTTCRSLTKWQANNYQQFNQRKTQQLIQNPKVEVRFNTTNLNERHGRTDFLLVGVSAHVLFPQTWRQSQVKKREEEEEDGDDAFVTHCD